MLAVIPPLTDDERVRLATAYDGRDHQEEAFMALLEHVGRWSGRVGDTPVRLHPDFEAMVDDPDAYRGELCRVVGAIGQQTRLPAPYDAATEWFVRDDTGRPILVYVVGLDPAAPFRYGERIVILGRFYKRVEAVARDGVVRAYPALVGAFPRRLAAGAGGEWGGLWVVAFPVAFMLVIFLVLFVYVTRRRRPTHAYLALATHLAPDATEGPPLPADPAEALAELRRRAEANH